MNETFETVAHDMAHGARSLGRRPGFTIAAGLSLALGIGVTTAIFTVLDAVALRPRAGHYARWQPVHYRRRAPARLRVSGTGPSGTDHAFGKG